MKARTSIGIFAATAAAATVAAVVLAPVSAFAGPATTTAAPQSLDVGSKGNLSARGAAVRIPFAYLCHDGWEGNLSVQVVQALGDDLASGYTSKTLKCSGAKKTTSVYLQVAAYQGARPFKAGPASAVFSLDSYDPKADPCSNGGPCPLTGPAQAAPPGGMFSAASMPAAPSMPMNDTFAHSEFQGTVTLVD